ncbi:MAG: helicase-related protein, partial [Gemmatimonadaceae bacterium]
PGVTVALTATATPATRADIVARLELNRPLVVVNGFDRPNLHFAVEPVRDTRERLRRISALLGETAPAPCIVYAGTRASVDAIARYLRRTWPHVDAYHAGRSAEDRSAVQRRFLDGTLRVLVATNAFGMGVDKPNVRLVAHAAPPGSIEAYYQEAGRAFRDGDRGRCVLLASGGDRALHDRVLASTYPPDVTIRRCWVDLNRHAGRDGCVTLPPAPLSGLTRDVEDPALALLARLGLVELRATLPADSNLRLLCTPATAALAAREVSPSAAQLLRALATSARPWQEQRVGDIANPVPQGAVDELLAKRLVFLVPPPRQVRLLSREREPPIDWRSLHARIGGERARIDAMHAYTTTTRCRRWYLLRYFGQHHSQQACGDCDNCARAGPGSHG